MDDLQELGKEVHDSLDPMGAAIADCLAEINERSMAVFARAFMAWAVPTHLFAQQLNQIMVSTSRRFEQLPALAYALPPFNRSMLALLEDELMISEMAVQWMAIRESCESLLAQINTE